MPEDTVTTSGSGPRPTGGDIYALLIGINEYLTVRDLRGCVADLDRVDAFLKKRFSIDDRSNGSGGSAEASDEPLTIDNLVKNYPIPSEEYEMLKVLRLEDELATYDNVILAFEKFLAQAKENDSVWIHFSGHGTLSATAPEFKDLENGQDNCLVCHDYRMDREGNISGLLADKELAQLLNLVAKDGLYHLLVTLDCCNIGTGTRGDNKIDEQWASRSQDLAGTVRPRQMSSYYGYNSGDTYAPPPSHIALVACSDLQLAGDSGIGGAFTTGLIDALETANNGMINYADLHTQTRFTVQRVRQNQTPQFDVIGDVKAYSLFLDGRPDGDPDRYPVSFESGIGWVVHCGAIHHLPEKPKRPILFSIYANGNDETPIVETEVKAVGPQFSTFKTEGAEREALNDAPGPLYAVFNQIPAPREYVKISGSDEAGITALKNAWTDKARALNIRVLEDGDAFPFTLEVKADDGAYVLEDLELGKPTDAKYSRDKPEEVLSDLITITKWRRTRRLEKDQSAFLGKAEGAENGDRGIVVNPQEIETMQAAILEKTKELDALRSDLAEKSRGLERKKVDLSFTITGAAGEAEPIQPIIDGDTMILKASKSSMLPNFEPGWRVYHLTPRISVEQIQQELHFYLLEMYNNYKVKMYSVPKPYLPSHSRGTIEYQRHDIGLAADSDEFVYHFKLIGTTKPLDYHQLLQAGIPDGRFESTKSEDPDQGFDEWMVIDRTLKVIRED